MSLGNKGPNQPVSGLISMQLSNYCLSIHLSYTTDFSDNMYLTWIVRFFF